MADTASDLFVERLMEWGVDTVFGLPGDTPEQAKLMYDALRRGEESRTRIGLTIGRSILPEATEPASPYGVLERVREKVGGGRSGSDGANGDGAR